MIDLADRPPLIVAVILLEPYFHFDDAIIDRYRGRAAAAHRARTFKYSYKPPVARGIGLAVSGNHPISCFGYIPIRYPRCVELPESDLLGSGHWIWMGPGWYLALPKSRLDLHPHEILAF
jgi:hypothetical protein